MFEVFEQLGRDKISVTDLALANLKFPGKHRILRNSTFVTATAQYTIIIWSSTQVLKVPVLIFL